jgi:hypothetical protein
MPKTYAASQFRMVKYSISASFKNRFIESSGKKPIIFRSVINSHPYYVRGKDLELSSRGQIVQVHLTEDTRKDQRLFETALLFFSSYVRNQMFSIARLAETPYTFPEPVDVKIDGAIFTYTPYSTDQCWSETLSFGRTMIATSTGKLI